MKRKTSVALNQETIDLIKLLSKKMNISQSRVIEAAVQGLDEFERVSQAAAMLGIHPANMLKLYRDIKEGVEENIEEMIIKVYQDELKRLSIMKKVEEIKKELGNNEVQS